MNYPEDIRYYDKDPRSPFYDEPPCEHCCQDAADCDCCEECNLPEDECECEDDEDNG